MAVALVVIIVAVTWVRKRNKQLTQALKKTKYAPGADEVMRPYPFRRNNTYETDQRPYDSQKDDRKLEVVQEGDQKPDGNQEGAGEPGDSQEGDGKPEDSQEGNRKPDDSIEPYETAVTVARQIETNDDYEVKDVIDALRYDRPKGGARVCEPCKGPPAEKMYVNM